MLPFTLNAGMGAFSDSLNLEIARYSTSGAASDFAFASAAGLLAARFGTKECIAVSTPGADSLSRLSLSPVSVHSTASGLVERQVMDGEMETA